MNLVRPRLSGGVKGVLDRYRLAGCDVPGGQEVRPNSRSGRSVWLEPVNETTLKVFSGSPAGITLPESLRMTSGTRSFSPGLAESFFGAVMRTKK